MPFVIDIDDVRDFLEGVERNARRQNDSQKGSETGISQPRQRVTAESAKKLKYLKNPKNREVDDQ